MTTRRSLAFLLAAFLLILVPLTAALQVTPDSPCSSFCLDAPDLDPSDPESSSTQPADITCHDEDFASRPEGQKFQRCLTCLQESDYARGHESDQQWFFYNLRYAFDYCVLGFPNATEVESSPCVTSEACGRIEDALKDGIVEPAHAEPYGYCAVDGGVMTTDAVDNCLSCVRAGNAMHYISNFLTAVQAGCEQQPTDGMTVGLSDTVFTTDPITVVLPLSLDDTASSSSSALSTPVIAGIAIGAVVFTLLAAGCVYMQIRKRRNRAARAARRASPLSFRCQTHLTPMTATFPGVAHEEEEGAREKHFVDPAAALASNPVSLVSSDGNGMWQHPSPLSPSSSANTGVVVAASATASLRSHAGLHSITTSIPRPPAPVASPGSMPSSSVSPRIHSPDDYFQTPTSSTSNAPLLASFRPYVPSDYSPGGAPRGASTSSPEIRSTPSFPQRSPRIGATSPRVEQRGWYNRPSHGQYPPSTWTTQITTDSPVRDLAKGKRTISGSPVSSSTIQTSFPPPPPPRK